MGWALKRSDGTYRAWNRNAQDDLPQAGEVWEELDSPPVIGRSLAEQAVERVKKDKKALLLAQPNKSVTIQDLIDAGLL